VSLGELRAKQLNELLNFTSPSSRVPQHVKGGDCCATDDVCADHRLVADRHLGLPAPHRVEDLLVASEEPREPLVQVDFHRPQRVDVGLRVQGDDLRGRALDSKLPTDTLQAGHVVRAAGGVDPDVNVDRLAWLTEALLVENWALDGEGSHVQVSRQTRSQRIPERHRLTQN
jgi:hypothetical protein